MTATEEAVVAIADDIVEEDRDLRGDLRRADGSVKSAKERRAEAIAALNQFRWEMVVCEHGPRFSQHTYAKAVGVAQSTISRGVDAWQLVVNETMRDASVCAYGAEPHHLPETVTPEATKPSKEQTEAHEKAKHIASVGELKAIAIELLAEYFDLATGTVERNHRAMVNDAVARFQIDHPDDDVTIEDAREALHKIAQDMLAEHKLALRREGDIKKWMAHNRGLDGPADIKAADARKMRERIERVMDRKSLSWRDAEAEVRESDFAYREAERIANEFARKARIAILDLREAAMNVKKAAIDVAAAVRKIEDDEVPVSDDERTLVSDDLDAADAAIRLARAALTGDSGTDWDAELAKL